MKYLILCCIALYLSVEMQAQDYKAEFSAIYENYENLEFYKMDIVTTLYQTEGGRGESQGNATIAKDGDNYYSHSSQGFTSIRNDEKILNINDNDTWVLYRDDLGEYLDISGAQYKEVLEETSSNDAKLKHQSGDIKVYEFSTEEPSLSAIEIEIDTKSKTMNKVVYYYNKDSDESDYLPYKVEMKLSMDSKNRPSSRLFDMSKYISFSSTEVSLQPDYSNYELLKPEN